VGVRVERFRGLVDNRVFSRGALSRETSSYRPFLT